MTNDFPHAWFCQSNSPASHLNPNRLTGDLLSLRRIGGSVNVRLGDQISALEKNTPRLQIHTLV